MLIDSHCHLDFPDFKDELDGVVARAKAAGVGRMVTISTRVRRQPDLLAIAERFDDVFCSVGTHPHHAHEELDIDAAQLVERPSQRWRSAMSNDYRTTTAIRHAGRVPRS
jgi:TatD DNase family protein